MFCIKMAKTYLYTTIISVCCIVFTLYFLNPVDYIWIPKCPVNMILGIQCPGCGIQRAVHTFLHGYYKESLEYNYFLIISIPYLGLILISNLGGKGTIKKRLQTIAYNNYIRNTFIFISISWFILRNIIKI